MANNDNTPSFDDLAIFLDICETGGFRVTAKRLGLSPSSVSEKISRLEQQLSVPLLTRTTRSVAPTDAGRALADRLLPKLKAVEVRGSDEHPLRVLVERLDSQPLADVVAVLYPDGAPLRLPHETA